VSNGDALSVEMKSCSSISLGPNIQTDECLGMRETEFIWRVFIFVWMVRVSKIREIVSIFSGRVVFDFILARLVSSFQTSVRLLKCSNGQCF